MDLSTQLHYRSLLDQDVYPSILQLHSSLAPKLPLARSCPLNNQLAGQRIHDRSLRLHLLSHQRRLVNSRLGNELPRHTSHPVLQPQPILACQCFLQSSHRCGHMVSTTPSTKVLSYMQNKR
jgi:hypothetical protein